METLHEVSPQKGSIANAPFITVHKQCRHSCPGKTCIVRTGYPDRGGGATEAGTEGEREKEGGRIEKEGEGREAHYISAKVLVTLTATLVQHAGAPLFTHS